jgi:Flp pilus assembly pilin Flp
MFEELKRLWQEDDAQDLAEYALLLMLVSLTAIVVLHSLAATTDRMFYRGVHVLLKHRPDDW